MRIGHSQWEREKKRKFSLGSQKAIAYGLIAIAFLTYSFALYKIAGSSSSSSSASSSASASSTSTANKKNDLIEPGSLMGPTDDYNGYGAGGTFDTSVDCAYSTLDIKNGGCIKDMSNSEYMCQFRDVLIDVHKMTFNNEGGESLHTVINQNEELEFIKLFQNGAFVIPVAEVMPMDTTIITDLEERQYKPLLMNVLESFERHTDQEKCSSLLHVNDPTLFVVRHGYVNLRHTILDLYNAHIALSQYVPTMSISSPVNIVFLDSHPQGELDSLWSTYFKGSVKYISSYKYQPTCFSHLIFPSPWYLSPFQSSALGSPCKPQFDLLGSFLNKLYTSYNIDGSSNIYNPNRVVIINRHPYVNHPRANSTVISRQITNWSTLKSQLQERLPDLEVILARPETLDFAQQIALFQSTSILIGTSGSGLMNTLFMPDSYYNVDSNYKSISNLIIELDPSGSLGQYSYLSSWKDHVKNTDEQQLYQKSNNKKTIPASTVHVDLYTDVGSGNSGMLDNKSIQRIVNIVSEKLECENILHKTFKTKNGWDTEDKVQCV